MDHFKCDFFVDALGISLKIKSTPCLCYLPLVLGTYPALVETYGFIKDISDENFQGFFDAAPLPDGLWLIDCLYPALRLFHAFLQLSTSIIK